MISWLKEYWFETSLAVAGILVVLLGVGGLALGLYLGGSESRAWLGDFVGGTTTPILTALTFIGVLVGIALQRRELIATRSELEQTREQTARSATALDRQADAIAIQNFERTLFETLSFLNSIADGLRAPSGAGAAKLEGREAFMRFYQQISVNIRALDLSKYDLSTITENEDLARYVKSVSPKLASYLRTLYNIYRYIDNSEHAQNKFYSRIVRAQLDDLFLLILFYNSLTPMGRKFQRYIRKYQILDNLPVEYLRHESHVSLFNELTRSEHESIEKRGNSSKGASGEPIARS